MLNKQETTASSAAGNVPSFLRKTYDMINNCDPLIATWSKDGSSFVVKNIDEFTSNILGKYFKHKNLSSFVRMLNFYGFRKIKYGPLPFSETSEMESKYLKFRHEKFQRGHPELLKEISRPNRSEGADKQEVERLRGDVNELKAGITTVSNNLIKLSSLLENLINDQCLTRDVHVMADDLPGYMVTSDMQATTRGAKRNHPLCEANVVSSSSIPVRKKQRMAPMLGDDRAFSLNAMKIHDGFSCLEPSSSKIPISKSPFTKETANTHRSIPPDNKISIAPLDSSESSDDEILTSLFEDGLLKYFN